MDKTGKFLLPSPKFKKMENMSISTPHFLSPQGMLLPKEKQPPPMFGPRGTTLPPKFLDPQRVPSTSNHNQFERAQKYFCEPCEAEFHTSTDYKVHRSEHTQCEIDNCSFRGHPSFMDTHIGQQHALGLYDQLKKLSTPEEIAQWRAERKKNYPTVASVAQKWKAREQRILRGERLEGNKSRFGRSGDRRQMRVDKQKEVSDKPEPSRRQRKRNRGGKQDARKVIKNKEIVEWSTDKVENNGVICDALKMFKGTGSMADYEKTKKVETHALSSLLGMYGSDSEDESENIVEKNKYEEESARSPSQPHIEGKASDDREVIDGDDTEEQPHTKELMEATESERTELTSPDISNEAAVERYQTQSVGTILKPTDPSFSDDEAPDEAPIGKTSNIPDKQQSEPPRKKQKHDPPKRKTLKSGLDYRKLRCGRQNTMLEKLLEPDIRHERNVLLQCVRFVVENNFFDIGSVPPQS